MIKFEDGRISEEKFISGSIGDVSFNNLPVRVSIGMAAGMWRDGHYFGIFLNENGANTRCGLTQYNDDFVSRISVGKELAIINSDPRALSMLLSKEEYECLRAGGDIEWKPGINYTLKNYEQDPHFNSPDSEKTSGAR